MVFLFTSALNKQICLPGMVHCRASSEIFRSLAARGIRLQMVNLGGGFPCALPFSHPHPRNICPLRHDRDERAL